MQAIGTVVNDRMNDRMDEGEVMPLSYIEAPEDGSPLSHPQVLSTLR
jgi:hypothetical protein